PGRRGGGKPARGGGAGGPGGTALSPGRRGRFRLSAPQRAVDRGSPRPESRCRGAEPTSRSPPLPNGRSDRKPPQTFPVMVGALTPEELLDLNQRVQGVIGRASQAHVHLCTAPATLFKELEEAVYQQVAAFAETQLTRAYAAEVYLEQHARDEAVHADLAGAF